MFRHFFPPAGLESADRKLLLLLGVAFWIAGYDLAVLSLALPDLQASFNISEEDLGKVIAGARLGALPAIFLALLADRIGRRSLLMVTLVGVSLCTGATGFARTAEEFVAIQFCARAFATAEDIIAVVYVLEMLPARHRGWGVGFLAAMGGLGAGAAALLYGLVNELPAGWRALYVIAALPILWVAWLRRSLRESPMFERQVQLGAPLLYWQPALAIWRHHRYSLAAIALISVVFWFPASAALHFMSKYLQETHHFAPGQVSLLFVVAGSVAIFGNAMAGTISDHIGRRPTLTAALLLNCAATMAFYKLGGWLLPLAWIAMLFSYFAVDVMVNAISGELFPTDCRSTAATFRSALATLAAVAGLAAEGSLFTVLGSHSAALSVLCLSTLLAVPVVLLMLRETSATQLS